jgi:hypothetical protein
MYTHTIPLFLKNKLVNNLLLVFIVSWMAIYPIYNNYYKGLAVEQYERFIDFKEGKSMFFNPWQYRVLCPLLIEGTYKIMDVTVFKLVDFNRPFVSLPGDTKDKNDTIQKILQLSSNPEFIKYTIVFLAFRFLQDVLILWLAFRYFSLFIRNKFLVLFALMIVPVLMGNAVMDSDLAFNSYMDVILYLSAGIVIIKGYNGWWIVLLTLIGAFNRETSLLIPVLYFTSKIDWNQWKNPIKLVKNNSSVILHTSIASLSFIIIFIGIRAYYGYEPQTEWRVPAGFQMLKLNLLSSVSIKTYNEMYGVFGFLPIWCLLIFKTMPKNLQLFFIVLIPIWFGVHLISVVAYQSRLFLVPTLLVLLPAVLDYIDKHGLAEKPATH